MDKIEVRDKDNIKVLEPLDLFGNCVHPKTLEDRGTYRYALFDVFGFGGSMYYRGMDCGYMALHNAINVEDV